MARWTARSNLVGDVWITCGLFKDPQGSLGRRDGDQGRSQDAVGDQVALLEHADDGVGFLLGGHLIGPEVTELLPELTLAQKWDLTATELARNVHAHPTLSEGLQEAIHGLKGHMINI